MQRWYYLHKIPLIPKFIQSIIFLLFNSKITENIQIGKGCYFVCKGISTVLVTGTKVGDNCVMKFRFSTVRMFLYKNVSNIGNNVWIGPNVVVAGPVEIGEDVIITANSFVNKGLPMGIIAAGYPAIIIRFCKDLDYVIGKILNTRNAKCLLQK